MTEKQRAAIDARKAADWAKYEARKKLAQARKNHNNRVYRARLKEGAQPCN